ncbi:excisionase family protein [Comamonas sp. MYb396]|uniref:excisionase family protein n=1 Tax=Comamonas sp. MYb396 TaxID=2745302 RepID=UPI0030A57587
MTMEAPVQIAPARFVTIKLAASITGLTVKAIERKIARGVWLLGKHYKKADGGIFIDMKEIEQWVAKATA